MKTRRLQEADGLAPNYTGVSSRDRNKLPVYMALKPQLSTPHCIPVINHDVVSTAHDYPCNEN